MNALLEWVTDLLEYLNISQAKKGFPELFGTPSVHPWLLPDIHC